MLGASPFAMLLMALAGFSLGLLGGGGSILAAPILMYAAGIETRRALALSLAVVGATSALAALAHARARRLDWRAAGLMAGSGMLFAALGARLSWLAPAGLLAGLFAALLLAVGGLMARPRPDGGEAAAPARPPRPALVLGAGAAVGLLTGFLGVGGGFLVVPALVLAAGVSMKPAVGTSLAVIALNSAAGLLGHLRHGVDLRPALPYAGVAAVGALSGQALSGRLAPALLRRLFGGFVIAVGGFVLWKTLRGG